MLQQNRYEIRIKGHIGSNWQDWFDGLTVTNLDGGETHITGTLTDQAALYGVLARIQSLNLPLLKVQCIEQKRLLVVQ